MPRGAPIGQCRICGSIEPRIVKSRCRKCDSYLRLYKIERPLDTTKVRTGPNHPQWKGELAGDGSKRGRARDAIPLSPCNRCNDPGTERHHKDENINNNDISNIEILCAKCHIEHHRKDRVTPPRPCRNCGKLYKPLRKGRCSACRLWIRKYGTERPLKL